MAENSKTKLETDQSEKASGGEMSVREAGKKGGDTVRDRYGPEFYTNIGRKGGQATRERHGSEFYESIGQKGGQVVKAKYGADFYEEIGHKGGQKVKQLIAEAKKGQAEAAERERTSS
ncbi:MAG: hypothetical protein NVSMB14_18440 [Isosphaeraceae bacterium]